MQIKNELLKEWRSLLDPGDKTQMVRDGIGTFKQIGDAIDKGEATAGIIIKINDWFKNKKAELEKQLK